MKPPFVLETYRDPPVNDRNRRIAITKTQYVHTVKIDNWQGEQESWPFDNEVKNCRDSHYNKIGLDCHCYATTTSDMLRQIEKKADYLTVLPAKKIISYFSFKDTNSNKPKKMFPEICVFDYRTTAQKAYTPPYPSLPTIRQSREESNFIKNRRMKREDPYLSKHKFWDEDIQDVIRGLQCKGQVHRSYDFCKGVYTDGSLPPEKKHRCVEYKSLYS